MPKPNAQSLFFHRIPNLSCFNRLSVLNFIGNLLGLVLSPILLIQFGWRSLFYIFGALGAPMVAFWMATVPTSAGAERGPRGSGSGSSGGLASFRKHQGKAGAALFRPDDAAASLSSSEVTLATLLSKSATWAIIVVNVVNHWGYFIYLNWMPSYFNAVSQSFEAFASRSIAFLHCISNMVVLSAPVHTLGTYMIHPCPRSSCRLLGSTCVLRASSLFSLGSSWPPAAAPPGYSRTRSSPAA